MVPRLVSTGSTNRSRYIRRMSDEGLRQAREKMTEAGVDPVAIEVFAHYYRLVESGETGMVPESSIEPLDSPSLAESPRM